jgi:hypothetical protein
MISSFLYPIFPVSLPNRDNVDDEGDLVVAQWLEEEKSEFDRALSSINDLTVGHQQCCGVRIQCFW